MAIEIRAYACDRCPARFEVDQLDPSTAHGEYLDHLATHDEPVTEQAEPEWTL